MKLIVKKCFKCGAEIKILNDCNCDDCGIMCCGEKMRELKPNSVDASIEKHKPTYVIEGDYIVVTVNHVMESDHYIEWICLLSNNKEEYVYLKPGDKPEAKFKKCDKFKIYSKCNKHGIWETE